MIDRVAVRLKSDIPWRIKEANYGTASQPKDKIFPHELLGTLSEVSGADLFQIDDKNLYLMIRIYLYWKHFSKLLIIKQVEELSADSLAASCKMVFAEYGFSQKIMSNLDTNFISETFENLC